MLTKLITENNVIYENPTFKVETGKHPDNKNLDNIYLVINKEHGVVEHATPKLYEALMAAITMPNMIDELMKGDSSEFMTTFMNKQNQYQH